MVTRGCTILVWFAKADEFLSNSEIPDNFVWLMKVDSNWFFRPGALPRILGDHDPSKALTFTSYVHVEGALEVASRGVIRKYGPGAFIKDTVNVNEDSIFDDRCLEYTVKHWEARWFSCHRRNACLLS